LKFEEAHLKAKIIVRLKQTVHDPQGEAIWQTLQHMGYVNVTAIRQGKVFDVELQHLTEKEATPLLDEIGRKVLANPIIEEYVIDLGESS
jgi:phosphoribosylformylglycinamidine synthase subunit PurS